MPSKKIGQILYATALSPEEALRRFTYVDPEDNIDIQSIVAGEAAAVMKSKVPKLPNPLTLEHFKKGQCPNPPLTKACILKMVATNPESPTEKEKRLADSITSDPVFTVSKGSLTPAKHLQMGVGLKHITGGDKVGMIISSYGHSISTTQEKEIITKIGISILEKKSCLPEGILPEPGLATTCDFDNYDELTDSINLLKEATHDTNGIVIQNRKAEIPHSFPTPGPSTRATSRTSQETPEHQENPAASGPQSQQSEPEATPPAVRGRKRRRKFDDEDEQITHYKKIPKADQFPYKVFK